MTSWIHCRGCEYNFKQASKTYKLLKQYTYDEEMSLRTVKEKIGKTQYSNKCFHFLGEIDEDNQNREGAGITVYVNGDTLDKIKSNYGAKCFN